MANINLPLMCTILRIVALFCSFLAMCLMAAFIPMYRQYDFGMWQTGWRTVWGGGITPQFASATIACEVFNMLYFIYSLIFLFWRPASVWICMIVDTSFLGFLLIFDFAAIGSLSANAAYFANCNTAGGHCHVGRAACAFGWFALFAILGLLAFQVTWTLLYYGMSMDTWRTPFNELVLYGSKSGGLKKTKIVGSGNSLNNGVAEEGRSQQTVQVSNFIQYQQHFTPTSQYTPVATNINQPKPQGGFEEVKY